MGMSMSKGKGKKARSWNGGAAGQQPPESYWSPPVMED